MFFKDWPIWKKNKERILYLFFGGCTTLINTVVYMFCVKALSLSTVVSNAIAWALAVLFAFIVNKVWVFESKDFSKKVLLPELISFVSCRLLTGAMDTGIMHIGVDLLHFPDMHMKILSNVLVIVLNYVFSKLFIFKNDTQKRK